MPNHLSPKASITSSGKEGEVRKLATRSSFLRPPVLLHLLADPVALHGRLPTKSEVVVLGQGRGSADSVASDGHLGVCSGSTFEWAFRRACNHNRSAVLLELVELDEQRAGYLLQFVCQHS